MAAAKGPRKTEEMVVPFLIGLAGPSGSGKTEVARRLAHRLGRTVILSLDNYYHDLSHLPPPRRKEANFDHPSALDWPLIREHLARLAQGEAVERPVYDFTGHIRTGLVKSITPDHFLLVEGLHALHEEIRNFFHLKIFLRLDHAEALRRRIERDVASRGRSEAEVRRQYQAHVRPMFERFVRPGLSVADLVLDGAEPVEASVASLLALIRSGRPGEDSGLPKPQEQP